MPIHSVVLTWHTASVFEGFTPGAQKVLFLARQEALLLRHYYVDTEHLLLGVSKEREGIGARTLQALDITPESLRDKIDEFVDPSDAEPAESPPYTPGAMKALELAKRESLSLGSHYIGTEHLLLAIVREGEGVAARVLLQFGANLERVRLHVSRLLMEEEGIIQDPAQESVATVGSTGSRPRVVSQTWVAGMGLLTTVAGTPDRRSPSQRRYMEDHQTEMIIKLAVRHAGVAQEPNPTMVKWVATNRRDANRVLLDAVVDDVEPVFALEVTGGTFQRLRGGPRGSGGPTPGSVLKLIVSQAFHVLDIGIGDLTSDLSPLGVVQTQRLTGSAEPD